MKFALCCLIVTSHGAHFPAQPTYDVFPFDECVKGQFDLCFSNSVMMYACFSFKLNTIRACRMSFISLFNFSILPIVFPNLFFVIFCILCLTFKFTCLNAASLAGLVTLSQKG